MFSLLSGFCPKTEPESTLSYPVSTVPQVLDRSIVIYSRIIHDNGFSSEEIEGKRRIIRENILDAMKILLFVIPFRSVDEIDNMTDFKCV